MEKVWTVSTPTAATDPTDAYFATLHPLVQQLLRSRGMHTAESAEKFLTPRYDRDVHDPFLFRDMRRAVDRVWLAIASQDLIIVHGDYDADGVCGAAILCTTLRALGANVESFLPHREHDGYGLNKKTVDTLHERGARLIITCDCGVSNGAEIAHANTYGIDVIITDHHQVPPIIPDAFAILHPKVDGETYPDQTLSGGGVAFKLAQGLLAEHRARGNQTIAGMPHEGFEKWLLDLVAISSVADMVPLLHETRALTRFGLVVLNKTRRIGLQKLLETTGRKERTMDTTTIGFKIAPRINAAGRMDHASEALALLMSETEEEAQPIAERIHSYNTLRQKLTEELTKRGRELVQTTHDTENDPILFVRGDGWSPGVIGLIASRLKDDYNKPVIVLGQAGDSYVGSGRSVETFHITNALHEVAPYLLKFGGHPQACGFTLKSRDVYDEFCAALTEVAKRRLVESPTAPPILEIDAELNLDTIDTRLVQVLEQFAPFGIGNNEPTFVARGVIVVESLGMGTTQNHTRLTLQQSDRGRPMKFVAFFSKLWQRVERGMRVDVVFQLSTNEWNGRQEIECKIIDLKPLV